MSIENHPNFHACQFVTDIIVSYTESLRGSAALCSAPIPSAMILDFVQQMEIYVDESVKEFMEKSAVEPLTHEGRTSHRLSRQLENQHD